MVLEKKYTCFTLLCGVGISLKYTRYTYVYCFNVLLSFFTFLINFVLPYN